MLNVLIDVRSDPHERAIIEAMPGVRLTDLVVGDAPEEFAREFDPDMLAKQDALFCSYLPLNNTAMSRLKLVQITSAGYSQLLGMDLPERGVRACNGAGVFDTAIAEWNVAMMVNLIRDLRQMLRNQAAGNWDRSAQFQREIRGATVGLWGYGGLARQTARLCKDLGMTVHALTRDGAHPHPDRFRVPGTGDEQGTLPDRVFIATERNDFLAGLDFLILALPLNATTEGIVGEAELRRLPAHAFVLNPARGPLIQEAALLQALRDGWIRGAALDTHYHYPMPADHPLWQLPNVIMTPHISGSAEGPYYLPRIWHIFRENLTRLLAGQPLLNELTAAQLSTPK